ncbi:DUF7405 family protein [Frankia tisae]|uniref:DUF7405 family protein n=1 Tax=Frankia tisae TaxID=2950104 RepID=UPI0021C25192|nr:hypothetical protein [Frankia tisae]
MSSRRPTGQHEWEATFGRDANGRPVPPKRHVLVLANVLGRPGDTAARHLEAGLAALEERYGYGRDGLLSTVGWGQTWWDQHTEQVGLIGAPSRMSRWEDPVLEQPSAIFHFASDHQDVLDDARETLFGGGDLAQGEYLTVIDVRNGFVGTGLPAQALPSLGIPASSPLLLGFHSVHRGSQATEESITIGSGPLAGGTTAHVSRIELAVERWHALDRDEQAALLFSPTHTAAQVEALTDDAPSDYPKYEQTVAEYGIVGHAQAAARARVNNVPVINRRDFATLDEGRPGTHFVALQRELRDFNNTRAIMNGADGTDYHRGVGARRRNGINAFFDVTRRATFGLPSRAHRAYPSRRS